MRKPTLQETAEKLADAKLDIVALELEYKAKLKPFEDSVEVLTDELLAGLRGMPPETRIGTNMGVSFAREVSTTFKVSDSTQALKWGLRSGTMMIDMTKARSKLLREPTTPSGFEKIETPKLSVKGLKAKKNDL